MHIGYRGDVQWLVLNSGVYVPKQWLHLTHQLGKMLICTFNILWKLFQEILEYTFIQNTTKYYNKIIIMLYYIITNGFDDDQMAHV